MFLPAVQYQNNNQGLNGFFGRLAKKLIAMAIKVMAQIPVAGPILADVLDSAVNDWTNNYENSWWHRTSEYEPTPAEEAIVTPWFENKVMPFYQSISTQLSNAFKLPNPQLQIEAINKVMTRICVAKEYHKTQNSKGLSKNAIDWRTGILDEILLPLESLITTSVSKISGVVMENASASATTTAADFSGLVDMATFNLANYSCKNYRLTSSGTTVIAPVITVPPTQGEPAKEVVIPVNGNPATDKKTKSIVPIVGAAFALYLILDGLTAKKKSK